MTLLRFDLSVLFISMFAGVLGSLLGLGGGIIIIPVLTLLFHVDIRYAIGASIVSVIATSSGAAAAYVKERMTNLRVAMVLELATSSGALTGAYLAGRLGALFLGFCLDRQWLERRSDSRALRITRLGAQQFAERFQIEHPPSAIV